MFFISRIYNSFFSIFNDVKKLSDSFNKLNDLINKNINFSNLDKIENFTGNIEKINSISQKQINEIRIRNKKEVQLEINKLKECISNHNKKVNGENAGFLGKISAGMKRFMNSYSFGYVFPSYFLFTPIDETILSKIKNRKIENHEDWKKEYPDYPFTIENEKITFTKGQEKQLKNAIKEEIQNPNVQDSNVSDDVIDQIYNILYGLVNNMLIRSIQLDCNCRARKRHPRRTPQGACYFPRQGSGLGTSHTSGEYCSVVNQLNNILSLNKGHDIVYTFLEKLKNLKQIYEHRLLNPSFTIYY